MSFIVSGVIASKQLKIRGKVFLLLHYLTSPYFSNSIFIAMEVSKEAVINLRRI